MLGIFRKPSASHLLTSKLYDNQAFYPALERDLLSCKQNVLIESPFLTTRRLNTLRPVLRKLVSRGVRIVVNTRDPHEHEGILLYEAQQSVAILQGMGVEVLYTGNHHRKLVICDRTILWEGSLNVLSQNTSCEVMRRIASQELAVQMLKFIKLEKYC
jgi:phosphatidylserine/phosphatidylglycerophosphate/cardiolipin synthase-like enzyme